MDCKNDLFSDDEFENSNDSHKSLNMQNRFHTRQNILTNATGMSKTELRKTNKPIMEKKRRARINRCLNEMKLLILEAMKKDPARHTKLEKADILEMTVKHLQMIQRQQLILAMQTNPKVVHKFKNGFMECANEVMYYINQLEDVDTAVKASLCKHLDNCVSNLQHIGSITNFLTNGYQNGDAFIQNDFVRTALQNLKLSISNVSTLAPLLPHNDKKCSVQLMPSRLPSGQFALIMPNTMSNNCTKKNFNNVNDNDHMLLDETGFSVLSEIEECSTTPLSQQINDFNMNFKRFSAFSIPKNKHSTLQLKYSFNNNTNNNFTTITKPTSGLTNTLSINICPINKTVYSNYSITTPQMSQYNSRLDTQRLQSVSTNISPPFSPISSLHNDASNIQNSDLTNTSINLYSISWQPQHQLSSSFIGTSVSTPSSAENSFDSLDENHLQQRDVTSASARGTNSDISIGNTYSSLKLFSDTSDSNISSLYEQHKRKYFKGSELISTTVSIDNYELSDGMWRPW